MVTSTTAQERTVQQFYAFISCNLLVTFLVVIHRLQSQACFVKHNKQYHGNYRAFSHYFTAAILLLQNYETVAMQAPDNPVGAWACFSKVLVTFLARNQMYEGMGPWRQTSPFCFVERYSFIILSAKLLKLTSILKVNGNSFPGPVTISLFQVFRQQGSQLNCTPGKRGGGLQSPLVFFFLREFFSRALLSERLEQAK